MNVKEKLEYLVESKRLRLAFIAKDALSYCLTLDPKLLTILKDTHIRISGSTKKTRFLSKCILRFATLARISEQLEVNHSLAPELLAVLHELFKGFHDLEILQDISDMLVSLAGSSVTDDLQEQIEDEMNILCQYIPILYFITEIDKELK